MAVVQGQAPNADAFDNYFRLADLDRDGRISGVEAVAFFQGFNLPKETLALVWSYAAGGNSSLGRLEFYNALRLVTVAQSGRQLTTDIVKAALYGPAAAKIPAPKINTSSASVGQMNGTPASVLQANQMMTSSAHTGFMRPPASQVNSMSYSSPQTNNMLPLLAPASFVAPSSSQINIASLPQSSQSGSMRPPASQKKSMAASLLQGNYFLQQPPQAGFVGPSQINTTVNSAQNNFIRPPQSPEVSGSHPVQESSHGFDDGGTAQSRGLPNLAQEAAPSRLLDPLSTSFQTPNIDSKSSVVSGNGFSFDSVFGDDMFSATQTKQPTSIPVPSMNSSKMAPVAAKGSINLSQPANQQAITGLPPTANHMQRSPSLLKQNQLDKMQNDPSLTISSVQSRADNNVSTQNDVPWPKITQSDIRKYIKVFHEVDKDRDGKITGPEARNLFLSWRLPRDVLRQVWDLSDQDNDSMLSVKEFCVALYLMERFREGRSLPSVLPNSVRFDQTLVLLTGQLSTAYGASAWQQRPVSSQQPSQDSFPVMPPTKVEASTRIPIPSQPDAVVLPMRQKIRVPVLEQSFVNQLSEEEQKALNSKLQEATDADNKVQKLEEEILDCKQKVENYRKQMQELVLYKSRCDSRLNETIERTAADKREVELLARKYEEKYKQLGDVTSKLTADQATFRDIQERKMPLYNLIAKMEQGEMPDGVHQEHADKIQNDLDELVKALNERCKEYGLRAKPTSLVELPFGWQPRIQGGAADWDEAWDKFDKDEGFTIIKELTLEVENVIPLEKPKFTSIASVSVTANGVPETSKAIDEADKVVEPESEVDGITDKSLDIDVISTEVELSNLHIEDGLASTPPGSPGRNSTESPSKAFQSTFSPSTHAKEHSEHGGADEVAWGSTFDSYDTDSVWRFSPIKTKEAGGDVKRLDSFSCPGDLGGVFGKERSPFFDSVPATPVGFSPKFFNGRSLDGFGRFDSFDLQDDAFPSNSALTRFDSMSSTTGPSHNAFSRFDSFGSTADTPRDFARFDSIRSTAGAQRDFARFDSVKREYGHGFSFDDSDPFGSGPFRTSEICDPKKSADQWSSF